MDAIALAYQSQGEPCPLWVRAHFIWSVASSYALAHGASLAVICRADGCVKPNTFARFYSLRIEPVSSRLLCNVIGGKSWLVSRWDAENADAHWNVSSWDASPEGPLPHRYCQAVTTNRKDLKQIFRLKVEIPSNFCGERNSGLALSSSDVLTCGRGRPSIGLADYRRRC